jgi:transposase
MGKSGKRYSAELQQQIVRVVRAGRTPGELAREFEPSEQTIRNWAKQAEPDGQRSARSWRGAEKMRGSRKSERSCQKPRLGSLR